MHYRKMFHLSRMCSKRRHPESEGLVLIDCIGMYVMHKNHIQYLYCVKEGGIQLCV